MNAIAETALQLPKLNDLELEGSFAKLMNSQQSTLCITAEIENVYIFLFPFCNQFVLLRLNFYQK